LAGTGVIKEVTRIPDYGGSHARSGKKILEGSDTMDHRIGEESPLLFGRSTMDARLALEKTRNRVKQNPAAGLVGKGGTICDR
jgi:hypothetical protein